MARHFGPKFDASMLASDDDEDVIYQERVNLLSTEEKPSKDETADASGFTNFRRKITMCCAGILVVAAVTSSFAIGTSLVTRYHEKAISDDQFADFYTLGMARALNDDVAASQRLPLSIRPRKYTLDVNVDMVNLNYTGRVVILIECHKVTNSIVLHSKNLQIIETNIEPLTEEEGAKLEVPLKISSTEFHPKISQMTITLNRELAYDALYALEIKFQNKLSDSKFGFFYTSTKDANGKKRYLAFTMFEPSGARSAFPCFDEPALKASFDVSVEHDHSYHAASNMPLKSSTKLDGGRILSKFERTPKMSVYLASIAITDFVYKSKKTHSEVEVRGFERRAIISQIDYAVNAAALSVNYFEKLLDMMFPLPKLDIFPIPNYGFNGAEEGWGIMTFSENLAIYNPKTDLMSTKFDVALVTIHEIAHQYFGDLVSIPWWTDLWLKESLAEYLAFFTVNHLFKEFDTLRVPLISEIWRALHMDQHLNTHAISTNVEDASQTSYDSIPYEKGSAFLRMLAVYCGEEQFFSGLQYYLKKYKYSVATQANLWNAIGKASGKKDILAMAQSWIYQEGFPLVTITSNATHPSVLKANQERFTIDRTPLVRSSSIWHIPLILKTKSSTSPLKFTMTAASGHISVQPSTWYKANYKWQGFYRVNYDHENWVALITQLTGDHKMLTPLDRASLIDDSFQLFRAGRLSADIGMGTLCYVRQERAYAPFFIAEKNFRYLDRFSQARYVQLLRKYIINTHASLLGEMGWTPQQSYNDIRLHTLILKSAIRLGHQTVIRNGTDLFNAMRSGSHGNAVSWQHPLRYEFIRAALRDGDKANWEYVWSVYSKSTSQSDQLELLSALSSAQNPILLKRLMSHVIDNSVPMAFQVKVIFAIAENPVGLSIAWETVTTHWKLLYLRHVSAPSFAGSVLKLIVKRMTTNKELVRLKHFLKSEQQYGLLPRLRLLVVEMVEANIAFLKAEENAVYSWLSDKLLGNSCIS